MLIKKIVICDTRAHTHTERCPPSLLFECSFGLSCCFLTWRRCGVLFRQSYSMFTFLGKRTGGKEAKDNVELKLLFPSFSVVFNEPPFPFCLVCWYLAFWKIKTLKKIQESVTQSCSSMRMWGSEEKWVFLSFSLKCLSNFSSMKNCDAKRSTTKTAPNPVSHSLEKRLTFALMVLILL